MEPGTLKLSCPLSAAKRVLLLLLLHPPRRAPQHPPQTPSLSSSDTRTQSFLLPWEHVGQALWRPLKLSTAPTDPGHESEWKHLLAEMKPGPHAWWPRRTGNKAGLSEMSPVGGCVPAVRRLPSLLVAWPRGSSSPWGRSESSCGAATRGAQDSGARKMES